MEEKKLNQKVEELTEEALDEVAGGVALTGTGKPVVPKVLETELVKGVVESGVGLKKKLNAVTENVGNTQNVGETEFFSTPSDASSSI